MLGISSPGSRLHVCYPSGLSNQSRSLSSSLNTKGNVFSGHLRRNGFESFFFESCTQSSGGGGEILFIRIALLSCPILEKKDHASKKKTDEDFVRELDSGIGSG